MRPGERPGSGRRCGLAGGARGHDMRGQLVGLEFRKFMINRHARFGPLGEQRMTGRIIEVDIVQDDAFLVTFDTDPEGHLVRCDMPRSRQKQPDEELTRLGQWQLLDIDGVRPRRDEAGIELRGGVCPVCLWQSDETICPICTGVTMFTGAPPTLRSSNRDNDNPAAPGIAVRAAGRPIGPVAIPPMHGIYWAGYGADWVPVFCISGLPGSGVLKGFSLTATGEKRDRLGECF